MEQPTGLRGGDEEPVLTQNSLFLHPDSMALHCTYEFLGKSLARKKMRAVLY